jgi:ArsR family transcriptional regulator
MNFDEMIVKLFKAMGHPIRYEIVKFLIDEPKCVCKLNENVKFSQSNLSQHLRILKEAGILKSEKRGLNIFYRVSSPEIKELIKSAESLVDSYIKNV